MKNSIGKLIQKYFILCLLICITACSGSEESKSLYIDGDVVKEETPENPATSDLKFCSPLSFDHVTWSSSLTPQARRSFAIALSISGRFEGHAGWANLTNNFDGQGMSAGLLNQALGVGSLQPLFWQMRSNSFSDYASSFSQANEVSVSKMLTEWKGISSSSLNEFFEAEPIHPSEKSSITALASPATQASVQWAKDTLYKTNGAFKEDWKSQMQTLLQKPSYISIQIKAAERIHNKAITYLKRVGMNDLRTYLLMFDIAVQNGSITEARFKEWEAAVKSNNLTKPADILKKLVDIRLQDTKPQWVNDVRSRKYAIIDGYGQVHGENLYLLKLYCYQTLDQVQ